MDGESFFVGGGAPSSRTAAPRDRFSENAAWHREAGGAMRLDVTRRTDGRTSLVDATRSGRAARTRATKPPSREQEVRALVLMSWVNSLALERPAAAGGGYVEVGDITEDFRDGTAIVAVVKHFAPRLRMHGTSAKAISTRAATRNLEESLNVLREKTGKTGKLYDVEGVLRGAAAPTLLMLEAAALAFVVRPELRGGPSSSRLVRWARASLKTYGRDVTPTLERLDEEFGDGVSVLCMLHAYGRRKPDMKHVYWEPQSVEEARANVGYGLRLLDANGVPCVFDVDTWCHCWPPLPDRTCLMMLLRDMFEAWSDQGLPDEGKAQSVVFRDEERISQLEKRAARPVTGCPVAVQIKAQAARDRRPYESPRGAGVRVPPSLRRGRGVSAVTAVQTVAQRRVHAREAGASHGRAKVRAAAATDPATDGSRHESPQRRRSRAGAHGVDSTKLHDLRQRLKAHSYGQSGQDPRKLFSHYDRDNSGALSLAEFTRAVRKSGHMTRGMISDKELRLLFEQLDDDDSGSVGVDELTTFVWGSVEAAKLGEGRQTESSRQRRPPNETSARGHDETDGFGVRRAVPMQAWADARAGDGGGVSSGGSVSSDGSGAIYDLAQPPLVQAIRRSPQPEPEPAPQPEPEPELEEWDEGAELELLEQEEAMARAPPRTLAPRAASQPPLAAASGARDSAQAATVIQARARGWAQRRVFNAMIDEEMAALEADLHLAGDDGGPIALELASDGPHEPEPAQEASTFVADFDDLVEVSFVEPGPLGLNLTDQAVEGVMVLAIQKGSQAEAHEQAGLLRPGLLVKIVGGQSVTGLSYEQVTAIIGSHAERPLHIVFMSVGVAASPRSSPRPAEAVPPARPTAMATADTTESAAEEAAADGAAAEDEARTAALEQLRQPQHFLANRGLDHEMVEFVFSVEAVGAPGGGDDAVLRWRQGGEPPEGGGQQVEDGEILLSEVAVSNARHHSD